MLACKITQMAYLDFDKQGWTTRLGQHNWDLAVLSSEQYFLGATSLMRKERALNAISQQDWRALLSGTASEYGSR